MALKDKKTKITFHNGILTIGGTIIEIAYEDSHIFFDFGSEYNPKAPVQPTDLQGLLDEGLVPYLNNMYDPRIPLKGYESKEDSFKNTAVFLSHVHLDHSKIVNYLNPSIPLYTLEGTKSLLNTFGEIEVKVMPVDHDAYGACGLLIKTPDLVISYTGDIRLHGYRENDTLNFCKESEGCDVLLIEGVSVSFQEFDEDVSDKEISNEPELLDKINEIVKNNPDKQITFNYYISNIERIKKIIETNPRKVVLDAYYSYVVKEATGYQSYYYQLDDKDYGLDAVYKIDFETLLNDQGDFFWQLDTLALEHIDKLKEGGIYIHSNAVPLGDFDPAYEKFIDNLESHKIEFVRTSCSGHAHPNDLIKIINLIKPKLLVPIHSYRPEKLYNENGDRLLPEKKQTI
ncbi:MBL fold metallo-hydrolase RNA specificity domain-containing protein [Clostridium sp.]|uniref:MBL fold metallo-hydrolase n=1 Tax=Clostridium sp. TaxID=1506 RepID=UPI002903AA8F|nr:MBL fold metallo-hydrolase RNA specificity domain-containing protein [Clostridium sp.]MDU1311451.1 MBL fold metallo-hydrolase RNA specificity domain-containing protein [Clostridium sp.]